MQSNEALLNQGCLNQCAFTTSGGRQHVIGWKDFCGIWPLSHFYRELISGCITDCKGSDITWELRMHSLGSKVKFTATLYFFKFPTRTFCLCLDLDETWHGYSHIKTMGWVPKLMLGSKINVICNIFFSKSLPVHNFAASNQITKKLSIIVSHVGLWYWDDTWQDHGSFKGQSIYIYIFFFRGGGGGGERGERRGLGGMDKLGNKCLTKSLSVFDCYVSDEIPVKYDGCQRIRRAHTSPPSVGQL